MIEYDDQKHLFSIAIGDDTAINTEMVIDSSDNNGKYAPHFGFGILFIFLLAIGFIPTNITSYTSTTHKKSAAQNNLPIIPIVSKLKITRPMKNSLQIYMKIPGITQIKKISLSYTFNFSYKSYYEKPSMMIRNTRHIFPSFSSKKSDFKQLIFADNVIDYSELEIVGTVSNIPEIKEVDILYVYENTSFTFLLIFIRINFTIILIILIITRYCRKTPTTIEQKACSLLNLATIFYNQPFSVFNFYKPTSLTVYLDIIFSDMYGPVLFIVSMFLISRAFDQKLSQTIIYLPFIYFGTTFFLSSINFLVHCPCEIPDQLGSLAFDLEFLNTFIGFIYFGIFCYYMIHNIQNYAGDPGSRLSTYRTIVLFVSIGTSLFYVVQAENSIRESLFSGIFQFGLVNTLAIVMEYTHSNKDVFLRDIYEEPRNGQEFSDNAIGEVISSEFSYEGSYPSEQYE